MRKLILLSLCAYVFVACASKPAANQVAAQSNFSIMQGVSGSTWVRLNLVREATQELVYSLSTQGQPEVTISASQTHSWPGSDWVVDEFEFRDLKEGTDYQFRVKDSSGNRLDERTFATIPQVAAKTRFAVVSCSNDSFPEQAQMWKLLLEQKPNWILAIGDNVYADIPWPPKGSVVPPSQIWSRYIETRNKLGVYFSPRLVPVVGLWDDHDYGLNGGDSNHPYKKEVTQIFLSFYPQTKSADGFVPGPGVSSIWKVSGNSFYSLDARSFRSEGAPSPACLKKPEHPLCKNQSTEFPRLEQRFSPEQERWFFEALSADSGELLWVAQGDQWFGAYQPFESFDGRHPESFKSFMTQLKKTQKKVVFLSGDRHSSEISKIEPSLLGYETYEVVSSPIHAKVFPNNWIDFPNPRQIAGVASQFNFTIIDAQKSLADGFTVLNYGYPSELKFEKNLKVKGKSAKANAAKKGGN